MHQKGFSQEESDSSNLLLSLMKQIEDVIILKFISLEKPILPNNKTWTISFSLASSASREQGHNGFNVFWKLRLNLCSLRWLKPTWRRVNCFKPEKSLVPKVLFAVGRIKSKSALWNTEYEGAWKIEVSSLFDSLTIWCKKKNY